MSEVLGDADPPARRRRPVDDDRPAFDGFDDSYHDFDDGFAAEPGPLRRFIAKVAMPESLAIAAIVVAAASLLNLPAVSDTVNSLSVSRQFDPTFLGRVDAAGQFVVAAIGFVLAIAARRRKPVGDQPDAHATSWTPIVSGGALIIAAVSMLLSVVSFLIAGTAHDPDNNGFQPGYNVPSAVATAVPPPSAIASFVIVDPSTGAQFTVNTAPSN
jgi:hypothetical protein